MSRLRFNANNYVYVRLTELGLQRLRDRAADLRARLPQINSPYVEPTPDERGFYAFQLWAFMETFGAVAGLGHRQYFEMDVEFDKAYLEAVTP